MSKGAWETVILIGFIVLLVLVASAVGVTDEGDAARILEAEGVTQVEFTGYDWFSCSEDDWYHTGFRGLRNGKQVSGVVCSGLITKASTVRYH